MIRLIDDYVICFEGDDHYVVARILNNDRDILSFVDVNTFTSLHKAIEFSRLYIVGRIMNGDQYDQAELQAMYAFLDYLDDRVVE